jgi:NADPH:quinone reductase-like Zn-dependent oxidoreductase
MKQVQFSQFGQPSMVAKTVEVPNLGDPLAWEVIVDIEAFPINPADLAMLAGRYGTTLRLPSPIGMEAVGIISAVGSAVQDLHIGDRVVLLANNNWGQQRKVPAAAVFKVPCDLDPLQLSMLKVNPSTAWMLLKRVADLKQNDWIVQTAPLSSVGKCIIEIAKQSGVRVVNVVRRPGSEVEVSALGSDIALCDGPNLAQRLRAMIGNAEIRYAFDAVGGDGVQRLSECLSEGATIVNYGMLSNQACQLSCDQTIFRGISLKGFWLSKRLNRFTHAERKEHFDSLIELVKNKVLTLEIDSVFSFDKVHEAIARAETLDRRGKVVVTVGERHA